MSIIRQSKIRSDFPWFAHHDAVYLDSAATTHKPRAVITALATWYAEGYAPVYRSLYETAEAATSQFEAVRMQTAEFIGARFDREIIFTHNATEGINIVARGWGHHLHAGDEIVLTELEHHANIIAWQQLAAERNVIIRWIPVYDDATLNIERLEELISARTRLVACTLSSNVVGPVDRARLMAIIDRARMVGAAVLLDASQCIAHEVIDVAALGVDFLVFSAHKMYGPTGVGVLYIHERRHEEMKPVFGGGGMAYEVTKLSYSARPVPYRFEVGTVDLPGIVGFGAAMSYLGHLDRQAIRSSEIALIDRLIEACLHMKGIKIVGSSTESALVSVTVSGFHPHDVAAAASAENIYLRAGNHCCQPLHDRLGIAGSVRMSVGLYSSEEDIQRCIAFFERLTARPML